MEPSFTPSDAEVVHEKLKELPAYIDSGRTGDGIAMELSTESKVHCWRNLVVNHGWYVDRMVFKSVSSVYVSIFPITEVPDSDGE